MTAIKCDIGVVGVSVMGRNLVLNMVDHGFRVAVYNRSQEKVDELLSSDEGRGKPIVPCRSLRELVESLSSPRKVLLMIKAGEPIEAGDSNLHPSLSPVDFLVGELCQLLSPGDIIIDGGNTHFQDTERRLQCAERFGLRYVGAGISGGAEGARNGPSIMPGGNPDAWPLIQDILQTIAARAGDSQAPCCDWMGPGGAGHYVKMVHNGIEYGNMQLICEAYWVLKQVLALSNAQLHEVFSEWNQSELGSYLIEITRDIFAVDDPETGSGLVDVILDKAGAKGTGKWMAKLALDLEIPSTLVTTAVHARLLSGMKEERCRANRLLTGPVGSYRGRPADLIQDVRQALFAATVCSYTQGFVQLRSAATNRRWPIDFATVASIWRGGCIIRADLLKPIKQAFEDESDLDNLLLAPYFREFMERAQPAWRRVVMLAAEVGIPVPVLSAALAYYDSYRSERLPANLIQAQRDYFGAHTYRRADKPNQGPFHTDWRQLVLQCRRLWNWLRACWIWTCQRTTSSSC
jgi:6-phosphogluconate dehydrogenase